MWPFLGSMAASLLGGVMGKQNTDATNSANAQQVAATNEFNANQAQLSRDFTERMSNTAYQRATSDMRAAGLNPALAYQQGAASTPSGATASGSPARMERNNLSEAVTSGLNSALSAAQAHANIQNTQMQTERARIETALESNSFQYDTALKIANAELAKQQWRFNEQSFADRVEQIRRTLTLTTNNARESGARAGLLDLERPKAANEAAAQSTWWKKHVAPYLNDATSVTRNLTPFIP